MWCDYSPIRIVKPLALWTLWVVCDNDIFPFHHMNDVIELNDTSYTSLVDIKMHTREVFSCMVGMKALSGR